MLWQKSLALVLDSTSKAWGGWGVLAWLWQGLLYPYGCASDETGPLPSKTPSF